MVRRPLLAFVLIACGWTWSPSLAGRAAAWFCGGAVELRVLVSRALRWRVGAVWYAFAVLAPLVIWMLANGYAVAMRTFVGFEPAAFALFVPMVARYFAVGDGLGEELGWRGFLQSTLERRHGARDSVLIVALVLASTNAAEQAVRTGFTNLHGKGLVTLMHGGFVVALSLAALVVKLPEGRTNAATPRSWARDRESP